MDTPRSFRRLHLVDDDRLGQEARAVSGDHQSVKLWLRLLSCSTQIEQVIRTRLRQQFDTTLARFDYLAQLERHPEGLKMNQLSRYLMVSGGNVTGLTDQLVSGGWVERTADPSDRRSALVRLTDSGRHEFLRMAREHEAWLIELFAGLEPAHKTTLYEMLGRLRVQLVQAAGATPAPETPPRARTQDRR
jgi:DNA-binding MarR family transcriptional regulator